MTPASASPSGPVTPLSSERLPAALRAEADKRGEEFAGAWAATRDQAASQDLLSALGLVLAYSEFVARAAQRDPGLLVDLWESGDVTRPFATGDYAKRLAAEVSSVATEADLAAALRRFRQRQMVRIAWRDLAGWAGLEQTTGELSSLAEAVLNVALQRLHAWHCEDFGRPLDEHGEEQSLVVVAMGKLGARELNFSSDIDLIFAYPEEGNTVGARAGMANQDFFVRLGQRLIKLLSVQTADGFVFRVDMRLRPFGDSGPLVASFEAMESYYQTHGREWERYAWVKARPVAGDPKAGARLMEMLTPFVYRRYLDFGVFQSLRQMKDLISREVRRKGSEADIKLGPGGIREVEFTVQVFQLIRGGRSPLLRERRLLRTLELLDAHGYLPGFVARELAEAYVFLRHVEHRLQEHADQQTHRLPAKPDDQARLSASMGFEDWNAFRCVLDRHRRRVSEHFEQIFSAPQRGGRGPAPDDQRGLEDVWLHAERADDAVERLKRAGFEAPEEALERTLRLRDSHAVKALSEAGRRRLDDLMPLLFEACAESVAPQAALTRVLTLVEAIARRITYVALLLENPVALSQLVRLCAASPWIARLLARHPSLLDELLDPRTLYASIRREDLAQALDSALLAVTGDLEQQMEVLRHFKQSQLLRLAAADVVGELPLTQVSDHLTTIAEVILERVVVLARDYAVEKYGRPLCGEPGTLREAGFAVVAYGKLGGKELGYGSDLDLVFLHDSAGSHQLTDRSEGTDNHLFFSRLATRIIHILTTHTPAGVLYDVDTRLRPSGSSGLLVSSLEAFDHYQNSQAWTWEHQALVRARPVVGSESVALAFRAVRRKVLMQEREVGALRESVCSMRARMRQMLAVRTPGRFDLKQDAGGIVDIEFIAQYAVLAYAHWHEELIRWTSTLPILEECAGANLFSERDAEVLADAYRKYRKAVHQLSLQEKSAQVDDDQYPAERTAIRQVWGKVLNCREDEETPG